VIIYGGTSNGFNGVNQIGDGDDDGKTWAYDVNTNTWERMDQEVEPPPIDWILIMGIVGGIGVVLVIVVIFVRKK
jgi:hypothetical protein